MTQSGSRRHTPDCQPQPHMQQKGSNMLDVVGLGQAGGLLPASANAMRHAGHGDLASLSVKHPNQIVTRAAVPPAGHAASSPRFAALRLNQPRFSIRVIPDNKFAARPSLG